MSPSLLLFPVSVLDYYHFLGEKQDLGADRMFSSGFREESE